MPDATVFVKFYQYYGTRGSLARFVEELAPAVSEMLPKVSFVYAMPTAPPAMTSKDSHLPVGFRLGGSRGGNALRFLRSEACLRAQIQRLAHGGGSVLMWELGQWLVSPWLGHRTITTVHEPIPPPVPRSRMNTFYYKRGVIPVLRRKRLCVAVSDCTRASLVSCGVRRTTRVHNWVSEALLRETCRGVPEREAPYLFVGTLATVKNLSLLLQMYEMRCVRRTLLCVVPGFDRESLKQRVRVMGLQSRLNVLCDQTDRQLRKIYQRAFALIVPSLSEGFGLPAAEAMAQGVPVVAADIEVMREVCADGAVYFNPSSLESLGAALGSLEDGQRRRALIDAGQARSQAFKLTSAARAYYSLIEGLL